jgi:tetratricopeptide (TPR) repeat protein
MAKLDALRDQPLSRLDRAVLTTRVRDAQATEIDAALRAAAAAIKAGRPGEVIKPLEAALATEPSGPRAALIHYDLGVAYARTDLEKAAAHLQAAVAGDVEQDDARFQLASVLDRGGAYAQARAEYDRFATAHPQSPLAVFALRRSAALGRVPAAAPPSASESAPAGPAAALAPGVTAGAAGPAPGLPGPAAAPAGAALPAPAGAAPGGPRPVRPWPRPWVKPPAKAAGSAAPPSESPADRAGDPPPE